MKKTVDLMKKRQTPDSTMAMQINQQFTLTQVAIVIILTIANVPYGNAAVMEAMIQIDSDSFRMTSFLQRFKRFIEHSHSQSSSENSENTWIQKFLHRNDTFQANYDFSKNQLTMASTYSLVLNGTDQKISDVKITINFRFNQETNGKIFLESEQKNVIQRLEDQNRPFESSFLDGEKIEFSTQTNDSTVLGRVLSPIIDVVEPIVITFIHIVVNGVLGHVLTTAFDQLYNGRLITM